MVALYHATTGASHPARGCSTLQPCVAVFRDHHIRCSGKHTGSAHEPKTTARHCDQHIMFTDNWLLSQFVDSRAVLKAYLTTVGTIFPHLKFTKTGVEVLTVACLEYVRRTYNKQRMQCATCVDRPPNTTEHYLVEMLLFSCRRACCLRPGNKRGEVCTLP